MEVAKGAGSALYGTDAIGGVINLISREPSHPVDVEMDVSAGNRSMLDASGSLGGRLDTLSFLVGGGTYQMDGYTLLPSSIANVGPDWIARMAMHGCDGRRIRSSFSLSLPMAITITRKRSISRSRGTQTAF
jgi:outer membrane cobalamin receptor